jgi:site-specific DNA recombinase
MPLLDSYVRVSKQGDREGERFISPSEQRDANAGWAAGNGFDIARVAEEINVSGARVDRPELQRSIERIEQGVIAGIVVAKLDRFFRAQLDGLLAVKRIRDAGGFFVSADGDIDTRDERGDMLLGIRLSIAEDERRRKRADFASGRKRAVARGLHLSPVPPFGYTRPEDERGRITGRLKPDPTTGPYATELLERAAAGEPWASIARWLNERGATTAYGKAWTPRTVKICARNRVYLGEARHGEYVHPGAHPALIDEITWRQAQRPGQRIADPRAARNPPLLSGLLRCAGCRHRLHAHIDRDQQRVYKCRRSYGDGLCPEPAFTARGHEVDAHVERLFFDAVGWLASTPPALAGDVESARRSVRGARAKLEAFRDDPAIIEQLGGEDFAAGVNARRRAVEIAEAEELRAHERAAPAALEPIALREAWPELDVREKKKLLALVIDCAFLRRGRGRATAIDSFVHVCPRGDAPGDLPSAARSPHGTLIRPFRFPDRTVAENASKLA